MSDTLAKNIRRYRKQLKMNQEDLANACDISKMSVRRYETIGKNNREPSYTTLCKLADALNVSVADLTGMAGTQSAMQAVQKTTEESALHTAIKDWKENSAINKVFTPESSQEDTLKEDMMNAFDQLNIPGKKKTLEFATDLSGNPKYQKEQQPDK